MPTPATPGPTPTRARHRRTTRPTNRPTAPTPAPTDAGGPTTGTDATARADLDRALQQAKQAIADGQAALASGDFAAYGEAQQRLDQAVQSALEAEARLDE